MKEIQLITNGGAYMLYSYSQCIEMFGTDRKIKQAIDNEQIFNLNYS